MLMNICRRNIVSNYSKSSIMVRMSSQLVKVQVKQGIIIGQQKSLSNGNFYQSFQGIPYAVPPLGELRFKSPLRLESFDTSELICLKERDISYQRDPFTAEVVGSEDCLYLNVYVPKTTTNMSNPLPVMVWIHGGGFNFGSGNSDYYLPLSLLQENVIVVTLNYRLGALGFLCLPEEGIWGNAGLKDQRLALQWVQDNIEAFNGDPKNVTLFGESAGAASVHLHLLSKHAKTLFHKAIMQSGTANMEWVFQSNPAYKTRRLAEVMGFKTNETEKIVSFLQSPHVKPLDILSKSLLVMTADERRRCLPLPFKPVIEDICSPDCFIDLPLWDRLKQPDSIEIPSIMGYNSAEGLAMMVHALKNLEKFNEDLERIVPRNIPLKPENKEIKSIANKMREFYLNGHATIKPQLYNNLTNILSDYHFVTDMKIAAECQVKMKPNCPLYFYRFDYVGDRNMYKQIFQMKELAGACHGDELFYLFQMSNHDMPVSDRDKQMILKLNNLWANFAKYSNPTPHGQTGDNICNWSPIRKPINGTFVLDYLAIENDSLEMKTDPDKERTEFWKNIYTLYPPEDFSRLSSKL